MNLTEGQLLFRLQDFHGAEQEALGIGDYEFFQESADIANALRELLQARRTIEELTAVVGQRNGECVRLHSLLDAAEKRIAELEKGHQETAKQINSWRRLAKQNIAERGKDISELEADRQRIAELEASHSKLRDTIAAIHNTIRMDGGYTPLAAILNAAKRAYEESASAAGIGVKGE
ncbi:hypothetical protein ACFGE5_002154 [Salmonella enterica]